MTWERNLSSMIISQWSFSFLTACLKLNHCLGSPTKVVLYRCNLPTLDVSQVSRAILLTTNPLPSSFTSMEYNLYADHASVHIVQGIAWFQLNPANFLKTTPSPPMLTFEELLCWIFLMRSRRRALSFTVAVFFPSTVSWSTLLYLRA
jgi:hypothetical protein